MPIETIPGIGGGRIKENGGRSEFHCEIIRNMRNDQ
jgi:hypothetical protein